MGYKITEYPAWFATSAKGPTREKMRFLIRYAALLATPDGGIPALSELIGMARGSLTGCLSSGAYDNGIPASVILKIEKVIGPGVIPRDMMNPTVYGEPTDL